jgi:phage terminase large subunit
MTALAAKLARMSKPKGRFPSSVFEPFAWQIEPWRDTSPILLLTGSAGGGKSHLAAEKVFAYAMKYPGSTCLIVRKNRSSMTNSTVLFMSRVVIGDNPMVKPKPSSLRWELQNGSVITWAGVADDQQREQLRSIGAKGGVDMAWIEEANRLTRADFDEVSARLRGTSGRFNQIILTTNPDASTHWIKQDLMDSGRASTYFSKAADNPANPISYLKTLEGLTGTLGQRLRDGMWISAEGVVYDEFEWTDHTIDRFEIPSSWRRFLAIDFGYTNPFVAQWWAMDGEDRLYRYREMYMTGRTVHDHAAQIKALTGSEQLEAIVADHDAEDRATLEQEGLYTLLAKKDISVGIQAVKQRLVLQADGRPRLFLMRDSLVERDTTLLTAGKPTCLEDEMLSYSWPEDQSGRAIKEVPKKVNDHACDTLRYAVMFADGGDRWLLA